MISSPFQNSQEMKEFDSESNSDEDRTTHTFKNYTSQDELLPFNFVPVLKPKKSCQTIIHLNLHNFIDEIEQKKYFSDGEINKRKSPKCNTFIKGKVRSVICNSISDVTYNNLLQDNDSQHNDGFYACSKNKTQNGKHLVRERNTIYLSLQKRKKLKGN